MFAIFTMPAAAHLPWSALLCSATAFAPLSLLAQTPPAKAVSTTSAASASVAHNPRPDPLDAKAAVPAALYLSPLRNYQAYAQTPLAPWRESNERVLQRGGWRNYAREAQAPASAAAPAASAAHRHRAP